MMFVQEVVEEFDAENLGSDEFELDLDDDVELDWDGD